MVGGSALFPLFTEVPERRETRGRSLSLLRRNVESNPQQVEYQDNEPSDDPTDRADEHGKDVDGYVITKNEVSEEQQHHSGDPIDDELAQITSASRQHEHDRYHHQYEYEEFH